MTPFVAFDDSMKIYRLGFTHTLIYTNFNTTNTHSQHTYSILGTHVLYALNIYRYTSVADSSLA